jgi:hypothetical protein
VFFAVLVLVLVLLFLWYKERTRRELLARSGRSTLTLEFPPGTDGAGLIRQVAAGAIAGNGNRPLLLAPPGRAYSPYERGTGRMYDPPPLSSYVSTLSA